jgi:hypothetical protein
VRGNTAIKKKSVTAFGYVLRLRKGARPLHIKQINAPAVMIAHHALQAWSQLHSALATQCWRFLLQQCCDIDIRQPILRPVFLITSAQNIKKFLIEVADDGLDKSAHDAPGFKISRIRLGSEAIMDFAFLKILMRIKRTRRV